MSETDDLGVDDGVEEAEVLLVEDNGQELAGRAEVVVDFGSEGGDGLEDFLLRACLGAHALQAGVHQLALEEELALLEGGEAAELEAIRIGRTGTAGTR